MRPFAFSLCPLQPFSLYPAIFTKQNCMHPESCCLYVTCVCAFGMCAHMYTHWYGIYAYVYNGYVEAEEGVRSPSLLLPPYGDISLNLEQTLATLLPLPHITSITGMHASTCLSTPVLGTSLSPHASSASGLAHRTIFPPHIQH